MYPKTGLLYSTFGRKHVCLIQEGFSLSGCVWSPFSIAETSSFVIHEPELSCKAVLAFSVY